MSPLANYTTQVPAKNSVREIQDMLTARHAKSIIMNFDEQGEPSGLAFIIPTKHGDLPFTLPANIDACKRVLERQAVRAYIDRPRASRVAWRILRDWTRAQMAILDTEMVTMEEIMLPYMHINGAKTLYQLMEEKAFLQLPAGAKEQG